MPSDPRSHRSPPSQPNIAPSPSARDAVEVRPSAHGLGLFAKRNFARCEVILSEKPILSASTRTPGKNELIKATAGLDKKDLARLLQLEVGSRTGMSAIEAIFAHNALLLAEHVEEGTRFGIFKYASRVNHSCRPNVGWFWCSVQEHFRESLALFTQAGDVTDWQSWWQAKGSKLDKSLWPTTPIMSFSAFLVSSAGGISLNRTSSSASAPFARPHPQMCSEATPTGRNSPRSSTDGTRASTEPWSGKAIHCARRSGHSSSPRPKACWANWLIFGPKHSTSTQRMGNTSWRSGRLRRLSRRWVGHAVSRLHSGTGSGTAPTTRSGGAAMESACGMRQVSTLSVTLSALCWAMCGDGDRSAKSPDLSVMDVVWRPRVNTPSSRPLFSCHHSHRSCLHPTRLESLLVQMIAQPLLFPSEARQPLQSHMDEGVFADAAPTAARPPGLAQLPSPPLSPPTMGDVQLFGTSMKAMEIDLGAADDDDVVVLDSPSHPAVYPFILRNFSSMRNASEREEGPDDRGVIMVPPDRHPYWAPRPDPGWTEIPSFKPPQPGPSAKGWGLMCTRELQRGDLIVREKPFITVTHPITSDAVKAAFDRCRDPHRRRLFLSFLPTAPGTTGLFDGIAETNVIGCTRGDDEDEEYDDPMGDDAVAAAGASVSGMFEHISRVNHSCIANAGWKWDEERGELGKSMLSFHVGGSS